MRKSRGFENFTKVKILILSLNPNIENKIFEIMLILISVCPVWPGDFFYFIINNHSIW